MERRGEVVVVVMAVAQPQAEAEGGHFLME